MKKQAMCPYGGKCSFGCSKYVSEDDSVAGGSACVKDMLKGILASAIFLGVMFLLSPFFHIVER